MFNCVHPYTSKPIREVMIQHQRRFLRLDDIPDKTCLSKGEVLDAIEHHKIHFCAYIDTKNLGAVAQYQDSLKVVSIFNYKGMVRLSPLVSEKFALTLAPQSNKFFTILEPKSICRWRSISDAFPSVEVAGFEYLKIAPIQPKQELAAYAGITVSSTVEQLAGSMVNLFSRTFPQADFSEMRKRYPSTHFQQLEVASCKVEVGQLRIDIEELMSAFGTNCINFNRYVSVESVEETENSTLNATVKSTSGQPLPSVTESTGLVLSSVTNSVDQCVSSVTSNAVVPLDSVTSSTDVRLGSVKPLLFTHPIKQMVYDILQHYPEYESRQIWHLLKLDVTQQTRQFDCDALIFEITADDLHYFGRGDTTRSISYRRFQNILSEVRKKLHV